MHSVPFRFFLGKKLSTDFPISDLTSIQSSSYCYLFSKDGPESLKNRSIYNAISTIDTKDSLIDKTLSSAFPVTDSFGKMLLEYVSYSIKRPKITAEEALERSASYVAPLYAKFRMIIFEINADTGASEIVSVKEQDVHLLDLPIMTDDSCSFILNGIERVVLSQIHRSPGVFFECDHQSSLNSYSARVIPHKGSWIDFEFAANGSLAVRINKRRKLPISVFLSAIGFMPDEVVMEICSTATIAPSKLKGYGKVVFSEKYDPKRFSAAFNLYDAKENKILKSGSVIRSQILLQDLHVKLDELDGSIIAKSLQLKDNISIALGSTVSADSIRVIIESGVEFTIVNLASTGNPSFVLQKGFNEAFASKIDSIKLVLKSFLISTPSEDAELQNAFEKLLFNSSYFNLSEIGRYKINRDIGVDVPSDVTHLTKQDIIGILKYLLNARQKGRQFSDTDSLANRRIRSVGELIKNQLDSSLTKVTRLASEKLNLSSATFLLPSDIIPVNIIASDIKEFLLISKLSQFVDQVNQLADLVHKRRITALGVGGLSRERAGFEVRDVHYSHYGRICPIETPEGQNIGLINSPACYAKLDKYGFIVSPYRKVKNRKIFDEVSYLESDEEKRCVIAQIEKSIIEDGEIRAGLIKCRFDGDFVMKDAADVEYIEVSPKQILSISSSLIPFVDHNDASRALMGANMQRQAVPLMFPKAAIVGTGAEKEIISNTNFSVRAKRAGTVKFILNNSVIVMVDDEVIPFDTYSIKRFSKTNHGTSFNDRVVVSVGEKLEVGQVIADGSSTDNGELAIGKDLLVAFMPWNGYNFEDAIIISEKVARSNTYASIHIEELELLVKDTKLGPEEITRHVPNVSEENLRKLDESGIVEIGSFVNHNDILVGKVTPKIEDVLMPEEKLLKAIFGDKNSNLRNASLQTPPGVSGVVIDVKIFVRPGAKKNERVRSIEYTQLLRSKKVFEAKLSVVNSFFNSNINGLLEEGGDISVAGKKIDLESALSLEIEQKFSATVSKSNTRKAIEDLLVAYKKALELIKDNHQASVNNIINGTGVTNQKSLISVKVYIARKRLLQAGDKMAGRHGNKGVISTVLPVQDMPFMEDGTSVDMVLNPLGVSSRMNIGQILETHVGIVSSLLGKRVNKMLDNGESREEIQKLVSHILCTSYNKREKDMQALSDEEFNSFIRQSKGGFKISIPPFEGILSEEIGEMFTKLGLDPSGQFYLYDGLAGGRFKKKVTVGYMHFIKLHHMVEDKVHARSVGPYSLVTQQPLGGRMHFGGQRFGEMECWALQAYGATYSLQEMITVKSDDISGRIAVYESIIKGNDAYFPGLPESFNVMMKELRSLCLNVELESISDSKTLL